MIDIRRSAERGQVEMGWLKSQHTFSFGSYRDPRFMGFGHLRVINEDRVAPGKGFGSHSHRNMEIISYVIEGSLEHRDSMGSGGVIRPGEVQVMSAGSGISHSEMNGSATEPVHFLQIWLQPKTMNSAPNYADRLFERQDGLTLLVSPDGRDGSLSVGQDAAIYRASLSDKDRAQVSLSGECWVQVIKGSLAVNGNRLEAGDGAAISEVEVLELTAHGEVEALVFDLNVPHI